MKSFIGRKSELQKLADLWAPKGTHIVVIKGRRRIGKSRLILEFAQNNPNNRFLNFIGLAPIKGVTAQTQRDHFSRRLSEQLNLPFASFLDWSDAFTYLAFHVQVGTIILFDEISWMGMDDPTFVPKLTAWWETHLSKKPHVLLAFCSSISLWVEKNILNSTAFFGRISLILTLEPLSLPECAQFLKSLGFKGSFLEVYQLLSVLGGIPWYLKHINPSFMADQNIKNLCFQKDGLLVNEFDRIFHDLFNGKGETYKKILMALREGMKTLSDIRTEIGFGRSGTLSTLMNHLIVAGFVCEHPQWSLKTEHLLKQSLYRICDPYIRFYLKNIEPNRLRIEQNFYTEIRLNELPGFESNLGLQVEQLLLQNRSLLLKSIGINAGECVYDGPYRQTKTVRTRGCQIDYLVQTRTKNLFLCEFKFKRRELGIEIIEEVQEKMNRIVVPRGCAIVPVLFHIGGVTESVYDKNFFYKIIDITEFVENHP